MACPAIITGDRFLARTIEHIDCQSQLIGSYGYQALGQPGSPATILVTGLLTLFVALIGVRLLFGPPPGARDVVYDALKVGVVITLAFSWPAFRTVIYDVVVSGPAEVASAVSASGASGQGFVGRLQNVDTGLVRLTEIGTGRSIAAFVDQNVPGSPFAGTALQDDAAFGWSRLLYLSSTIASIGLLRLLAGLLLALAPLAAGLLLFEASRGVFSGWLRGLVLAMLGAIGVSVVLAVELSVLEPLLSDAIRVRAAGYATPSTPIELFAIALAFAAIKLGMIALLARVAFTRGWPTLSLPEFRLPEIGGGPQFQPVAAPVYVESRAQRTADSVERLLERETRSDRQRIDYRSIAGRPGGGTPGGGSPAPSQSPRLGSTWRRSAPRRNSTPHSKGSAS